MKLRRAAKTCAFSWIWIIWYMRVLLTFRQDLTAINHVVYLSGCYSSLQQPGHSAHIVSRESASLPWILISGVKIALRCKWVWERQRDDHVQTKCKGTVLFAVLNYLGENKTLFDWAVHDMESCASLDRFSGFTADGKSAHHKKPTHILLGCFLLVSGEEVYNIRRLEQDSSETCDLKSAIFAHRSSFFLSQSPQSQITCD